MTPYSPKRHERGTTLHRYCVRDDDVQGFGEWLVFVVSLTAIAAGLALIVSVAGFGYRPGWLVALWGLW